MPLVIAGDERSEESLAYRVDALVRQLRPSVHYRVDEFGRNVTLTDAGIAVVEKAFHCDNLFDDANLTLHAAVQDSLHAHTLLRRDVDYLVKNGAIESVDEFKGRIIQDRRWPDGLHAAIEAREGVAAKESGPSSGFHHDAESGGPVSDGVRHDRYCRHSIPRVSQDIRLACRDHSNESPDDPRRSTGHRFSHQTEKGGRAR